MNNRVNSFGVAEPSISRQGNDIVVELPGVKDQAKALRLVGRTAQLRFRPVLANIPGAAGARSPARRRPLPLSADRSRRSSAAIASCDSTQIAGSSRAGHDLPTTPLENDNPKNCVILPDPQHQAAAAPRAR